eukprot:2288363-Amphidinium_carterae.1
MGCSGGKLVANGGGPCQGSACQLDDESVEGPSRKEQLVITVQNLHARPDTLCLFHTVQPLLTSLVLDPQFGAAHANITAVTPEVPGSLNFSFELKCCYNAWLELCEALNSLV